MNGIAGKRCAVYTRTAAAGTGEANPLASQCAAAEAYIAAHGGIILPDHYGDLGQSGNTADRPALTRLLRDVAAGGIERVVVQHYHRLARNQAVYVELLERLRRHGVELVSATEPFGPEPIRMVGKAGVQ